jgi:glycosyltransferase involved in cell wall biosynthesis
MSPSKAVTPRMRVLTVLSSSNQMYSGIGRAVFELSDRLRDRIAFEFAIDDLDARNLDIVQQFAKPRGIPVHVGRGRKRGETLDNGNDDLPGLLRAKRWDAIECVCWANADTNAAVLEDVGDRALIFTPHHQPPWSVPMNGEQAEVTAKTYRAVVRRADVVLCDSPWERREVSGMAPTRNHAAYLPLGCDFGAFRAGGVSRKEQLLFVGDLSEPRKRFDRVLALMQRLRTTRPGLRLVVIGNRSERADSAIPEELRDSCDLRGYASEAELRAAYAESLGLVLLSEFEAFGIPILESLASGTPVFLSRIAPTFSLFGDCRGAHFCPADDLDATAELVGTVLNRGEASIKEAIADRGRLASIYDWDRLAAAKWSHISAAWFGRNRWAWTVVGQSGCPALSPARERAAASAAG